MTLTSTGIYIKVREDCSRDQTDCNSYSLNILIAIATAHVRQFLLEESHHTKAAFFEFLSEAFLSLRKISCF